MEGKDIGILKKCSDLFESFIEEVFPFIDNYKCNKVLDEKINELFKKDLNEIKLNNLYENNDLTNVPLSVLKDTYNNTLERKKVIENKAKTNVLGVTVCVTVMAALADNIAKLYMFFSYAYQCYILYVFGIVAVLFLLLGGFFALELLMKKNKVYITRDMEQILPEKIQKKVYGRNNILNEKSNLIRTNYMNTSYQSIRNGLVLFLLIFMVSLWPGLYKKTASEEILHLKTKIEVLEIKNKQLEANTILLQEYVKKLEKRMEEEIVNKSKVTGVNTFMPEKERIVTDTSKS